MKRTRLPVGTSELRSAAPLAMSEASMRLRMVVEEHDKLLTLVARRRNALERLEQEIRAAVTLVSSQMVRLMEEAEHLSEAIHKMFEALAADPKRTRRERNQIRQIHRDLQKMGVLSPREMTEQENAPSFAGSPGGDDGCRYHNDDPGFFGPDIAAVKETERGVLRDLYRRLAEALHPDKVQDEQEKAIRTDIMKEITVAYSDRDFARLVEIERTWASSASVGNSDCGDATEQRLTALVQANHELRKQMRELERRLRRLRNSEQGRLSKELRQSDRAGGGPASVVSPIEDGVRELRQVHDFVQAFHDGKISLAEFMEGPAGPDEVDELDDDLILFGQALAELMSRMDEEGGVPRRSPRKPRGKRARPAQERRRA